MYYENVERWAEGWKLGLLRIEEVEETAEKMVGGQEMEQLGLWDRVRGLFGS